MFIRAHKGIFSDSSSLILRAMLREPSMEWSVRDFLKEGVSVGLSNRTLNRMERCGYIVRERRGRNSFSRLVQREKLIRDWVAAYSLDMNFGSWLHDPGRDFLPRFDSFMKERNIRYILTGFSASRLISPYVLDKRHFVYVDIGHEKYSEFLESLQDRLGFLKLVRGGNIWISLPYYKSSVFRDRQILGRYPVASNLQIFLDLMKLPAGVEEVEHLKQFFRKRGGAFV